MAVNPILSSSDRNRAKSGPIVRASDYNNLVEEHNEVVSRVEGSNPTTATATTAGLTTGALVAEAQFVTVTSASANNVICLPVSTAVPIGTVIAGWVGDNGFELRVDATEATTATINGVTTNVEAAIPATTLFYVTKVAALTWVLVAETELGARIAAIVPDAV